MLIREHTFSTTKPDVSIVQQQLCEQNPKLTALHLFVVLRHVVGSNTAQKLYVIVTVKFCHFFLCGLVRSLKQHQLFHLKDLNFYMYTVLHYYFIISTSQKRLYIMYSGSRKFPFFGKVRNSVVGCESSLSDGASWDDPAHSNSCLCHLKNAKTFK